MSKMTKDVETYFAEGCGRCSLFGTPQCKVHKWEKELAALRKMILDCGLHEESKWGMPCYTFQKANILLLAAFKEYCSISFFKGALLQDPEKILSMAGENSQAVRMLKFTNVKDVIKLEKSIKAYIYEAIEVEKAGLKIEFKKVSEFGMPEEFEKVLKKDKVLKTAFDALTPGRQRGYLLFFAAAKQSKTREARIEKCKAQILKGKGLND